MDKLVTRDLPSPSFWAGKRVFLTGHTGFKGGWLGLWLAVLGAKVQGYALAPNTMPDLFSLARVGEVLADARGDVRDAENLRAELADFEPDIVLHLAAQPLVRASYAAPLETYATNIMGTANLLAACAGVSSVRLVGIVTSDKVYAESSQAHVETDRLGGHDPYSGSKAAAELVAASFPCAAKLAMLRAGNVIGGGDWSADRLVPDFFRAAARGEALRLRNPRAVRPWQHVLEALCGYLLAIEFLWDAEARRGHWNFGPGPQGEADVETVIATLCGLWPGSAYEVAADADAVHEAAILRLEASKAQVELGWRPRLSLDAALRLTAQWHRAHARGQDMQAFSLAQIEDYTKHD
ncbi:CDP-glucose 4,6-dehydratase [Acidocella facilis]|uniref:CDP-glucose 4,6-dehydratase n=1 Tax=Acidocella facilis TaxID=525 RepID=UPI001F1B5FBD|nr:CDP-glucose 4,6-dehydratase [Acidocella facilis]